MGDQLRTDDRDVPEHWVPAVRVDVGRLRKAERTPAGGVRVPGAVSRAGILTYRLDDGSIRRELVLPEEMKRADALASLRDAPVTVGHPDGGTRLVTPDTYRQDAAGHVSGDARVEGDDHIIADLVVQDAETIRRIDSGELSEISPGYRVMIDPTPGEWNGQRYDAIQRRRVYNHVALLPKGGARGGSSVALRLDGEDVEVATQVEDQPKTKPAPSARQPAMRTDSMGTKIRIDDVEYELDSDSTRQVIEKKLGERDQRLDSLTKERDELQGKHDAVVKERDELRGKLDEATDPKRLDARVQERAQLVDQARRLGGEELKVDGLSDQEIMVSALKAAKVEVREDWSEGYIRGRFEQAAEATPKPTPITSSRVQPRADGGGADGDKRMDAHSARQRMLEDNASRWNKPFRDDSAKA